MSAGFSQLATKARWALDKATGGGITASDAVPFADFERAQLPQLRQQTAAALNAMPGLAQDQKEPTLTRLMETARQAFGCVCTFQGDHADGLGRRSAALLRGAEGRGAPAGANQNLWNKQDPQSPFMQTLGQQVQNLVEGLLKRAEKEAAGARLVSVLANPGGGQPFLSDMVAYAKSADPERANAMPFVPSLQCNTAAVKLAKAQLTASVVEKFTAPSPEKREQKAAVLLATAAGAESEVKKLVSKTNGDPTPLTAALKEIVAAMSDRLDQDVGSALGGEPSQTLGIATGVLKSRLQAAALTGPAGPVSSALWHASQQVEGLATQQRHGPSAAPVPTPEATQKLLQLETSKILHQAGGSADMQSLQEVVGTLQPLVNQRMEANAQLWNTTTPNDFQVAQRLVSHTVPLVPQFKALGLEAQLPEPLKNASAAQLSSPAGQGDLMTRLALAWKPPGQANQTGFDALMRGCDQMLTGMGRHLAKPADSAALNALTKQMYAPEGPTPLSVDMMLGAKAAAAQMVLPDPAATPVKQNILNTRAAAVTSALVMGAVGGAAPLTTPKEVLAQAQAQAQAQPALGQAHVLSGVLVRLQQDAALSIAEKATQCGARLATCLLQNAGSGAGLQALEAFEDHSAKANAASDALAANQGAMTMVMESRLQLEMGLQDLDDNAPAKQAAQRAFNALPIVQNNMQAHANNKTAQSQHQASSSAALGTLLTALIEALPTDAANAPLMDTTAKNMLSAFLNATSQGHSAAGQAVSTALNSVSGAALNTVVNHLQLVQAPDAANLSSLMRTQQAEIAQLGRDLVGLKSDEGALNKGDFDQMKNSVAVLKGLSSAAAANAPSPPPNAALLKVARDVTRSMTGVDLNAPPLDRTQHQSGASGGPAGPLPSGSGVNPLSAAALRSYPRGQSAPIASPATVAAPGSGPLPPSLAALLARSRSRTAPAPAPAPVAVPVSAGPPPPPHHHGQR